MYRRGVGIPGAGPPQGHLLGSRNWEDARAELQPPSATSDEWPMATWIVGDIHGCAEELATLIDALALGPQDTFVSVGDLFHRGPDPAGVVQLLDACGARFVLGNHEVRVLRRAGLLDSNLERRELSAGLPELDAEDLRGDGDQPCHSDPHERRGLVEYLSRHDGYFLRDTDLEHARPTRGGRPWNVVHAGVFPGVALEEQRPRDLISVRRLNGPGRPWWYEFHEGPELILFGHTPSPFPRAHHVGGELLALGLDTGCVYGGKLTAYCPELEEFHVVPAVKAWAEA